MREPAPCPQCGRPATARGAVNSLAREVERLRELAETRSADADRRRIEELSREVWQLRETVARLRGGQAPLQNRH